MPYPQLLDRKLRYKAYQDMTLHSLTRDLHHVCEDHKVGASMSRGDIGEQWWADWLECLKLIHEVIDQKATDNLKCYDAIVQDIKYSSKVPRRNHAAEQLAKELKENDDLVDAAQYVITGAHLMGGAVMKKAIGDRLPKNHLAKSNREAIVNDWLPYRDRVDLGEEARHVFRSLIKIMDEIVENDG